MIIRYKVKNCTKGVSAESHW